MFLSRSQVPYFDYFEKRNRYQIIKGGFITKLP